MGQVLPALRGSKDPLMTVKPEINQAGQQTLPIKRLNKHANQFLNVKKKKRKKVGGIGVLNRKYDYESNKSQ